MLWKIFTLKIRLLAILILFSGSVLAQKNASPARRDTLALYKKIKEIAYRHKLTKMAYHYVFVDPAPPRYEAKPLSDQQKQASPLLPYDCRIIRSISIQVLDPFGHSVNDTAEKEINRVQKLGNHLHITTRHWVIRNMLLFKVNEPFELFKINESERLLRNEFYVYDARIYVVNDPKSRSDSVDVKVVVMDRWTRSVIGSASPSTAKLVLRERNMFGTGQFLEQGTSFNKTNGIEYHGAYAIRNIYKTYISNSLSYSIARDFAQVATSFDKPFYSSLTKWAGGAYFVQNWRTLHFNDTLIKQQRDLALNSYSTDIWLGKSMNMDKGKLHIRRLNNIILALRYARNHYEDRPSPEYDQTRLNFNSDLLLGSIGFSMSKYYKDQFIYRFGANEDIPEGVLVQLLYGFQHREYYGLSNYYGMEISRGKHYEHFGYISAFGAFGTFVNPKMPDNTTVNLGLTYFSDLAQVHRWYYRQFIYVKYVNGYNKPVYERIALHANELYGLDLSPITGCSKMLINIEGVTYAPYNVLGFHFAPLVLAGFGFLKTGEYTLWNGPVYQSYAVGLLLRNENLLNTSFQVTFGFYPNPPPQLNAHYYRFNPSISFNVKFRSFAIGKPVTVGYE
jgi:hypothetical protein